MLTNISKDINFWAIGIEEALRESYLLKQKYLPKRKKGKSESNHNH